MMGGLPAMTCLWGIVDAREGRGPGMRQIVRQLRNLFEALGCVATVDRTHLAIEEPGLISATHYLIAAGLSRSIGADDLARTGVRFVVIEDDAPLEQVLRLQEECARHAPDAEVQNLSRFVDRLWDAEGAAEAVRLAAEGAEDLQVETFLGERSDLNPNQRYVQQMVRGQDDEDASASPVSALELAEDRWLSAAGGPMVVLAGAGVGKSELAVVLSWRNALTYHTQAARSGVHRLPSIAVRVPLRQLRELSLTSIAAHLEKELGFDRVRSPRILSELLDVGRVALLLDGVDELPVASPERDIGLAELARVAERGCKVLVTARVGYYGSHGAGPALFRAFPPDCIWTLQDLTARQSRELLHLRGASDKETDRVFAILPSGLTGIPLFLIWAWRASRKGEQVSSPALEEGLSQAGVLRQLVELFCERDEHRVQLPWEAQMNALKMVAAHSALFGGVTADELAASVGDPDSSFVRGPHALLARAED
jgi:hypothetical protein